MIKTGKIIGLTLLILFFAWVAFLLKGCIGTYYVTEEYWYPNWMGNDKIIAVKYVYHKVDRSDFLSQLSKGTTEHIKDEIQIVSMNIDGSDEKVLNNIVVKYDLDGAIYPKGFEGISQIEELSYNSKKNLIVFCYRHEMLHPTFLLDLDNARVVKIIDNGGGFSWFPDGSKLVYGAKGGIWVYDLDTKDKNLLIKDGYRGIWSPDNKKIFFLRNFPDEKYGFLPKCFIYELENKKEEVLPLENEPTAWLPDGSFYYHSKVISYDPEVSPDGKKIVGWPSERFPSKKKNMEVYPSVGIADIDDKNLRILRFREYEKTR